MVNALRHILQNLYPYGVFRTGTAVYLTFDDGPIPEVTPKVLEILDRYHVKATFFMVGENIDKHPEVFHQVVKAGHALGNHTYNHLKGIKYSQAEYLANAGKAQRTIERHMPEDSPAPVLGPKARLSPNLFRPPYGKAWLWQRRALRRMGYRLIYWDVLTRDYDKNVTPAQMLDKIKRMTGPGSIINFHDSLKSNERMLAVLPQAIEWLQAQGYDLRSLDERPETANK